MRDSGKWGYLSNLKKVVGFEVLTPMFMKNFIFWDITPFEGKKQAELCCPTDFTLVYLVWPFQLPRRW
jgi:hypothetical protein